MPQSVAKKKKKEKSKIGGAHQRSECTERRVRSRIFRKMQVLRSGPKEINKNWWNSIFLQLKAVLSSMMQR